jgi:hypothetical protein
MVSTTDNGWLSCIDNNNYDTIKININMWCQYTTGSIQSR